MIERDPRTGKTYADRFPAQARDPLWCAECGKDKTAAELDWWQLCRECREWWANNGADVAPEREDER